MKLDRAASRAADEDRSGKEPVVCGRRTGASLRSCAEGAAVGERERPRDGLLDVDGLVDGTADATPPPGGAERPLAMAHPQRGADMAPLGEERVWKPMATGGWVGFDGTPGHSMTELMVRYLVDVLSPTG